MSGPDHISEDGARKLAKRIRAYWRKRDLIIETSVHPIEGSRDTGGSRALLWAVRTDMVNGYPRPVSA